MAPPVPPAIKLFISYSYKDDPLRKELEIHLANLKRQGKIQAWTDRAIEAGQEWEGAIKANLESAQILLLLISPDFINSDYCYDLEMKRALDRHKAGEARVIPIILRPVDWQATPFSCLQVIPRDAKPLTTWDNRDEAYVSVVQGIRKAVETLIRNPNQSEPQKSIEKPLQSLQTPPCPPILGDLGGECKESGTSHAPLNPKICESSPTGSRFLSHRLKDRRYWGMGGVVALLAIGLYLSLPSLATRLFTQPGIAQLEAGERNAAEAKLNWAIRLNANDANAHFQLAKLYEDRQELDKAQDHYQKAVRGDILPAKNNLARLYIRAQDSTAAVNLLLQILDTAQDNPLPPQAEHSVLKNLGWARLQQGNDDAASEHLQTAIALEDETVFPPEAIADTHCLMAQVIESQGTPQKALPFWQTCNENALTSIPEQDEWIAMAQDRLSTQKDQP